jgi:hypothetical protein
MIQIGKTIVSLDLLESSFLCDLQKCKGACCVYGDSGAPLEDEETEILNNIYPLLKPYLRNEGIKTIDKNGTSTIDSDGDKVTPLIDGKECAYTYYEGEIVKCAIEKAFKDNVIEFQKPVSCHLYPVRLRRYPEFIAVNYDRIGLCKPAIEKGIHENIQLFIFLKDPLIRKFGIDWYKELKISNDMVKNHKTTSTDDI